MGIDTARAPLDVSRITTRYWRVRVVDVTGSTQDDLVNSAEKSEVKNGDVIVTNFQSSGRGRLDRTFEAPPSTALLFSFYLQPPRTQWSWIPLLVGQSISQALSEGENKVLLKWPNDLIIAEKKVGGIISTRAGSGVVVGVGINVGMSEVELPVEGATSLFLSNINRLDRTEILNAILLAIQNNLEQWLDNRDGELLRDYSSRCLTLGKTIEIIRPDGSRFQGVAKSIAEGGELRLESGEEISVGDITHLR